MADGDRYSWYFGTKILMSELRDRLQDKSATDQRDYASVESPDQLDDDYWRWVMYRKPVTGLLWLDRQVEALREEADREEERPIR